MKRFDLIETKLQAIKAKNSAEIVAKAVYLPFIGRVNKVNEVQEWLAVRIAVLEDAKILSEPAIEARIKELTETLPENCKELLELKEVPTTYSNEDYEILCKIWLYQFSLGLEG